VGHTGAVAEYSFEEKGDEFLESFTDPGPPFDPAEGPPDVWFRRVVELSAQFTIAFSHDGTIVYVSDAIETLLGHRPAELIGTNALDLIHPDDLENAAETVYHAAEVEGWRPPRPFRLLHHDGSAATFEVEGLSLFHVDEVRSIVCIARYAESAARVDAIVGLLAAHAPLAEILDQLVHVMDRPGWHFAVAVQYDDGPDRLAIAHTGLPDELLAFDRTDLTTPWGMACDGLSPMYDLGLTTLAPPLAAIARAAGYQTCWAVPVKDPGREPSCVVVWNYELHPPELGQQILLDKLCQLLELALAGRARSEKLEQDATTDALSGLANRRAFEAALQSGHDGAVAVLFLDLDGFKAVNDELGHTAGDEVIREVGARIAGEIRRGDLAARIGGDEFAIVCRAVTDVDEAVALAERLLASVPQPVDLATGRAEFDLSIGIAVAGPGSRHRLDELVDTADKQLYLAKQRGRGRWCAAVVGSDGSIEPR